MVKDACGKIVQSANTPAFQQNDVVCNPNAQPFTGSLNVFIEAVGEYTVTYRLRLSDDVINTQTDYYINNNIDLKKLQQFFEEELAQTDLMGCYSDCESCKRVGDLATFTQRAKTILQKIKDEKYPAALYPNFDINSPNINQWITTQYNAITANCILVATDCITSPCEQKLDMMKYDVRPGGQYLLFDENFNIKPGEEGVSILNYNQGVVLNYKNEPDYVITNFAFTDEDGVLHHIKDAAVTVPLFIKAYLEHPEWADDFVKRHIEYCSYLWCKDGTNPTPATNNEASYLFDEKLREVITKGDEAIAGGYFNPANYLQLSTVDPFFNGGRGSVYKTQFQTDLGNLSTVLKMNMKDESQNNLPAKNIQQLVEWILYCKPANENATSTDFINSWACAPDAQCRSYSAEWELYRNYYLQLKSKYVRIAKQVFDPTCDNCFIGQNPLATNGCIDPGPLTNYTITGGPFTLRVVYLGGTTAFKDNYTITVRRTATGALQYIDAAKGSLQTGILQDLTGDPGFEVLAVKCQGIAQDPCADGTATTGPGAPASCPSPGFFNGSFGGNGNPTHTYPIQTIDAALTPQGSIITVTCNANDVPNRMTISDAGGTVLASTGWFGVSSLSGPWGSSLNTPPTKQISFPRNNYSTYTLTVETVFQGTSDAWDVSVSCSLAPPPTVLNGPPAYCTNDPRAALFVNKARIFNEYVNQDAYLNCAISNAPLNTAAVDALKAASIATMRKQTMNNLDVLKVNWLDRLTIARDEEFLSLASTTLSNGVLSNLVNNLYLVAAKYIEIAPLDNIRPASTLPTPYTVGNNYNNFAAVFDAIVGPALVHQGFGPALLDNPYPYDKSPVMASPNGITLNADICSKLTAMRNRWTAAGSPNGSFYGYLKDELKDDFVLTPAELADMETRCANGCSVLNESLLLPAVFAPTNPNNINYSPWISCTDYNTKLTAFSNAYPNVTAGTKLYRNLLTNFMNAAFGYSLSFEEYEDFKNIVCGANANAVLYTKPVSRLISYDPDMVCTENIVRNVFDYAGQEYEQYIALERRKFRNGYISKCLSANAAAKLQGTQWEYHYTLYYYGQDGNLVKTIPPEGVHLLDDKELADVETFRGDDPAVCNASGIPLTEEKATTLNAVSTALQANTAKGIEFWLYSNNSTGNRQLRFITPDNKYLYQAAISNDRLWVEMYSIQVNGSDVSVSLSNQAVGDISNIVLKPWTHLMIQSDDLTQNGLQLYMDGAKLNSPAGNLPSYPFDWQITPGPGLPAEDISALKHLRVYNRLATDAEVYANYRNSCLSPVGLLANWTLHPSDPPTNPLTVWGRFNIPAPGSETTTGGGTQEYVNRFIAPDHTLPTNYAYNSLNQVVKQSSPDGGTSEFYYDRLGRLTISQNAEQKQPAIVDAQNPVNRFSYTRYDALGRITEVGEKLGANAITEPEARNQTNLQTWLASGSNRQVTVTAYDAAPTWAPASLTGTQTNLRKRVAATALLSTAPPATNPALNRSAASYYSYDLTGNVHTLVQENTALSATEAAFITGSNGLKQIKYEYDLVSGKVNKVLYQDGKWDQFYPPLCV